MLLAPLFVFVALVFATLLGLPGLLARAWVITKLWVWFVAPYEIPLAQVVGVMLLIGLVRPTAEVETESKKLLPAIIGSVVGPLFVLGMAYIVHLFM